MIKNYNITTLAKIDDNLMNSHSNSRICAWMSYRRCSVTSGAVHFSVFGLHRFDSFVCANNKMFKNDFVFHSQMLNDIFDCDVDTVNLTKLSLCYMSCVKQKSSPRNENFNWLVRIKFLNLFLYSSLKKLKNLLVRTKFYWSWAGGPVLMVSTGNQPSYHYSLGEIVKNDMII